MTLRALALCVVAAAMLAGCGGGKAHRSQSDGVPDVAQVKAALRAACDGAEPSTAKGVRAPHAQENVALVCADVPMALIYVRMSSGAEAQRVARASTTDFYWRHGDVVLLSQNVPQSSSVWGDVMSACHCGGFEHPDG